MQAKGFRVLILTYRMAKGYGVDVVVDQLCSGLKKHGHHVYIGCIDNDGFYQNQNIFELSGNLNSARRLIQSLKPHFVIIHTTPYFELLPDLKKSINSQDWALDLKWIVWEHGDPTPSLFPNEEVAREAEKLFKQQHVYPVADQIVVISDFVGRDIGYSHSKPPLVKIYNGSDHAPDRGPKTLKQLSPESAPLRIGLLTRLGQGESFYKGAERFHVLLQKLEAMGVKTKATLMGRGSEEDASTLRKKGFDVVLNGTEDEKWQFLREVDIFVSCSRWEGFNLPLVEAQALGTVSFAFDVGAHGEVCEHVFVDEASMANAIARYSKNRAQLLEDSVQAYAFVRKKFNWQRCADKAHELMTSLQKPLTNLNKDRHDTYQTSFSLKAYLFLDRMIHFLKQYGVYGFAKRAFKRIRAKFCY